MKKWILFVTAATALFSSMPAALAVNGPAPGAVTAQTVKVPDGPGSVRGLASDASVSAFSGQVAFEIPIDLPNGPGGLAPTLALSYSGALGNGPLGIGWTFGQIGIRRSLRLGVPTYTSDDEFEFIGLAGTTLVAIGNGQYRAEGQGNAIRGTAVDGGFEIVDTAGTRYRIGTSDGSRVQSGTRVAAWLLERVTDVAGHVIDYTYERRGGELYLTSIAWGGSNVFRADLVYEDRPDRLVSWRTGFSIAADRRLISVRVAAFGGLRNTVALTYDESFALSRLKSVQVIGHDGTASSPTTLSYAPATVGQAQPLTNTGGWNLSNANVSFFDVDKDGAMDLLRVDSNNQRYRRNLGGSFGPEIAIGNAPSLTMSSVRMLDLDGDSGAEMVSRSGQTWRSFRIVNNAWTATDWPGSSALDLENVATADLNGDNRMDVLMTSGNGLSVWFGTSNGFGAPRSLPRISANESAITPLSVEFHDLNGDGLADAVAVNDNGLIEFRGRGDGTFERVGPIAYPWTGTIDTAQLRLADLDRDGVLDLVRVGTTQVFWHRGKPDGSFMQKTTILSRPPGADSTTVVQLADANGNGSTDVVWSSTTGMWVLDLAGPTNAGLLAAIDNGLGKVQRFEYTASAQLAWAAEKAGNAWSTMMPVSIAVTTAATLAFGSGEPDRRSLLAVRDGIYDHAERRFIGFASSIQTRPGVNPADTIRVTTHYHAGRGEARVLRGQVLSAQTEDGNGNLFKLVENEVAALAVDGLTDDARLKRAAVTQTLTTTTELGQPSAMTRTRFFYDGEGRLIEEARDGSVALTGDETILRYAYTASDPVTGVRDLVCEEVTLDGAAVEVSRARRLFGDSTTTASLCQPSRGWVREELGYLAEESRWVNLQKTTYDANGNPILTVSGGVQRAIGYDSHDLYPISESVSPSNGQTLTWTAQWNDVAGTVIEVTAPNGTSSQMTYDGLGRLTSTAANGAPPHLHYRYNWVGPRPRTETFIFDGDPAVLSPLPGTWTPASGWRHTMTVANGAGERILTAVRLDSAQWSIGEFRQRDHRGRVIALTSAFSFAGSDPSVAEPPTGTPVQTMVYDPLDRIIDQILANGTHKRSTYHPLGATVAVDGLAPVRATLDGQGRTIHTERTVNGVVESLAATYDAAGRILRFSLQGGQAHHDFGYDSLGRLLTANDPDAGPRTMQYDDGGRVTQIQNGAGDIVTYGYDGVGRLTTLDGTGVTTRFHYDVPRSAEFGHTGGQLAWVEEPTGSVDLGYDNQGRQSLFQRTFTDGSTTITGREGTHYAPSGLVRSVDLGDGVVLPIHYDAAGRLSQVDGALAVESYDTANLPFRERFANGVIQRYERDVLNRPTRVILENSGSTFYDVGGTYNPFGALDTLADTDQVGLDHSAVFGFDDAGRLTAATIGVGSNAYQFSYAYNGLQNLVQRTASGPTQLNVLAGIYQYQPSAPRRLSQIVAGGQIIASFGYDGAGRQTLHAGKQLTYDALSRLVRVEGVAGGTVEHRYGHDGTRVATRDAAGALTCFITPHVVVRGAERDHYVRIGDRLITKITTNDNQQAAAIGRVGDRSVFVGLSFLWLIALIGIVLHKPGLRRLRSVMAASLALLMMTAGCTSRVANRSSALTVTEQVYFHQTYSAGPELTTTASGQLHEERRTEPFGVAIDAFHGGAVQPVDYRRDPVNALNKLSDPDTGWSDHGARWLAPETAQWQRPDPAAMAPDPKFMSDPWGLNPYQYGNQNPIAFWDPDGRSPASVAALGDFTRAAGAGAAAYAAGAAGASLAVPVAAVTGMAYVQYKVIEAGAEAYAEGRPMPIASGDAYQDMAMLMGQAEDERAAQKAARFDNLAKTREFLDTEYAKERAVAELQGRELDNLVSDALVGNTYARAYHRERDIDPRAFVVRLQAQGGGLEKSVVLFGPSPITASAGVAGLHTLKGKLNKKAFNERRHLFERAARFIQNAPSGGGVGPPGKSFSDRGSDIRVDVEVLRGINFQTR